MPPRPAYGPDVEAITLLTNYGWVRIQQKGKKNNPCLFVYNLEVTKRDEDGHRDQVDGPLREKVVRMAIPNLRSSLPKDEEFATDFKTQLVSDKELSLNESSREGLLSLGRQHSHFVVEYLGPSEVYFQAVKDYYHFDTPLASPPQGFAHQGSSTPTSDDEFPPPHNQFINALNIILGHHAREKQNVLVVGGNRFFDPSLEDNRHELETGIIAARGYFHSIRPVTSRLLLNANVIHAAFRYPVELRKVFEKHEIHIGQGNWTHKREMLKNILIGAIVKVPVKRHNEADASLEEKTIRDVSEYGPGDPRHKWVVDGQDRTVLSHFKDTYGVNANEDWPVIDVGTRSKKAWVPAEAITLLHSRFMGTLLTQAQKKMLDFSALEPFKHRDFIESQAHRILRPEEDTDGKNAKDDKSLTIKLGDFSITVGTGLTAVPGREIPTPQIVYHEGQIPRDLEDTDARSGFWNMSYAVESQGPRENTEWKYMNFFETPKSLDGDNKWAVLSLGVGGSKVQARAINFQNHLSGSLGLRMGRPWNIREGSRVNVLTLNQRFSNMKTHGVQFVLVVLPNTDSKRYEILKKIAEVNHGIATNCVVWPKKFETGKDTYYTNVALKLNLKLGGKNHMLKDPADLISCGKTMFVGYDVIHPTGTGEIKKRSNEKSNENPQEQSKEQSMEASSIVGLVASRDKDLAQWPAVAWRRNAGVEIGTNNDLDLQLAIASRLDIWAKNNTNTLPENIIIYRDGVSESQYQTVIDAELPNIKKACSKKYAALKQKQPYIAIIVCVKRHQTRFYPTDEKHVGFKGNVRPGTVVDRGITQVRHWDFFLTAHRSLQGTSRPAHYVVIFDEVFRKQFPENPAIAVQELENITHQLCYTYGRSTTAVSYATPAYYADRVCARAKVYENPRANAQKLAKELLPANAEKLARELLPVATLTPEQVQVQGVLSTTHEYSPTKDWPPNAINVHPDLVDTMWYI